MPHRAPARPSLIGWGSAANKITTKRIDSESRSLAHQGVRLTQWGPDVCTGKVKVYLEHYSDAAARTLIGRYGNAIIVSHRPTPPLTPLGRSGDTSPYTGGDFILTPVEECSGGPIVVDSSGNNRMLSAGHCDPNGVNDLIVRSDKNGTFGPDLGKVEAVRLCNNCIDSLTIKQDSLGVSYNHNVWGGGNTNNPQYTEDGSAFPQPGILVTQDSAFTGEITGLTIAAVNQTAVQGDMNVVELTKVTSNSTICHPGDSGGPWIQHEGSTNNVKIVGTTVGSPNPSTCTTVFYQQIGGINSHFGTHVPS